MTLTNIDTYEDLCYRIWNSMKEILGVLTIRTIFIKSIHEKNSEYEFLNEINFSDGKIKLPKVNRDQKEIVTNYTDGLYSFMQQVVHIIEMMTGKILSEEFRIELEELNHEPI